MAHGNNANRVGRGTSRKGERAAHTRNAGGRRKLNKRARADARKELREV